MSNTTYSEKLKSPKWQRKRLEILQRDNFMCKICGDKEITLNVHHSDYENKFNPWEISNDKLITLCEKCHYIVEKININDRNMVVQMVLRIYKNRSNK